ncbi:MAG TPA: ribonuclease P protein component [Coleofasciculaceae cyanobacterium]
MALPKIHRLRRRQDFSAVYRSGLRRSTAHLTLRALHQSNSTRSLSDALNEAAEHSSICPTRLGISVSQKVSKRAVVRNRIKRQIRAAFHHFLPQLSLGWQVVVVVKPNAAECDYEQILQELKQLLINAEVMNGS